MIERNPQEHGQALVEFSLVLPVLVIMTIGSILLGIYFTQRSTMTGITFIAAREAALSPNPQSAAARVQQDMARGGPGWLQETQVRTTSSANAVAVTMTRSGNMNVPLLAAAGRAVAGPESRPLDHFADFRETVMVQSEVVLRSGGNHSQHPKTSTTVDYRHKLGLKAGELKLSPDLQHLPLASSLLQQVAPQSVEMDPRVRNAALSGCAEIPSGGEAAACSGTPANPNLHGPSGFFKEMGYSTTSGRIEGDITTRLSQLRAGATLQKTGLTNFLKVLAKYPELKVVLDGLKAVARGAEAAFSGIARLTKATNDVVFGGPIMPLTQYQQAVGSRQ